LKSIGIMVSGFLVAIYAALLPGTGVGWHSYTGRSWFSGDVHGRKFAARVAGRNPCGRNCYLGNKCGSRAVTRGCRSYLSTGGLPVAQLFNFHALRLKDGLRRFAG
jgi:hypothetical protein